MADKKVYIDEDHQGQEIKNVSLEKLGAHPTGPALYEGRVWQLTTDDHLYYYSGGAIRQVVNAEDLNRFGTLVGGHDASSGIPTTGSGVDSVGAPDSSIQSGDSWRVTVAGSIPMLASGDAELSVGDVLIALVDSASVASDFMAIQLNLPDSFIDEVQSFSDLGSFPGTGSLATIYIAEDDDLAYLWDGAGYKSLSLPNIQHEVDLAAFPATGDADIIYIADDTDLAYFWDGSSYIPLSGTASNFYSTDGTLAGNRTVAGDGKNLTFSNVGDLTFSSDTQSVTTVGNYLETIGGNRTEAIVGSRSSTAAGQIIASTGGGNNISLVTDPDAALILPSATDPDVQIVTPLEGMIKYDSTDHDIRAYVGGSWVSLLQDNEVQGYANFAAFPGSGNTETIYIAEDTDITYIWDGAAYKTIGETLYSSNGTIGASVARTVTLGAGATLEFIGDFAGTLFSIDGDSGKITMDGLLDPSGVQMTPAASNPGNSNTIWSNSSDSDRPYWGNSNKVAFLSDIDIPEYTVGTLPSPVAAGFIMVTDETGGYVPAFSDGSDWRRVTDRAVVS